MLKLLLKKQLLEIFRSYYYDAKKEQSPFQGGDHCVYGHVCGADGSCSGRHFHAVFG